MVVMPKRVIIHVYMYSERSASTIDYIIPDFQVGDRLESIHMPLVLDLQFGFIEDIEDSSVNEINNICPPKYSWNSVNQQTYNNQLRLNLERILNDFHNPIANKISNYRYNWSWKQLTVQGKLWKKNTRF